MIPFRHFLHTVILDLSISKMIQANQCPLHYPNFPSEQNDNELIAN